MRVPLLQYRKVLGAPLCHDDAAPTVEEERGVVTNSSTNLEYAFVGEVEVERAKVLLPALIVLDIVPAPTNGNCSTVPQESKIDGWKRESCSAEGTSC